MSGWLNPFAGIIQTKGNFQPSRSLRTSFWQKIFDTFCVFAGGIYGQWDTPKEEHAGLLDFLSIFIFYHAHNFFWEHVSGKKGIEGSTFEKFGTGLLLGLSLLINLPKYIIACVLTLISVVLVIIPVVQPFVHFNAWQLKNDIYKLKVAHAERTTPRTKEEENKSFRELMSHPNGSIVDLNTLKLESPELVEVDNRVGSKVHEDRDEGLKAAKELGINEVDKKIEFNFVRDLESKDPGAGQKHKIRYKVIFNIGEDNKIIDDPSQEVQEKGVAAAAYRAMFHLNLAQITVKAEKEGRLEMLCAHC